MAPQIRPASEHPLDVSLLRASLPMIGREEEVKSLMLRLKDSAAVTLIGPPGVGKSRLARHIASRHSAEVTLVVDVSNMTGASNLISRVAIAVGAQPDRESIDDGVLNACLGALGFRGIELLVFDDIDPSCASVVEHLSNAMPELTILASARAPLRYAGEHVERLNPLDMTAACELYVDRARRVAHDFDFDCEEARAQIEALVERLDCLPLAIELAAGRARMLPPVEFLKRLPRRLELLRTRERGVASLSDSIASAVDELDPPALEVLGQMSLLCGPIALEAAEAILKPSPESDLFEVLEGLIDCSMIVSGPSRGGVGEVELRVLESIQAFMREHHTSMQSDECFDRAIVYLTTAGERWRQESRLAGGQDALCRLEHAAASMEGLIRASERGRLEHRHRLALVLDALWCVQGAGSHHEALLDVLIDEAKAHEVCLVRALQARASLHHQRGQHDQASALHQRISELAEEVDVHITVERAQLSRALGESAEAAVILERVLEHCDLNAQHEALVLVTLATALVDLGDMEGAGEIAQDLGDMLSGDDLVLLVQTSFALAYVQFYLRRHGARLVTYEQAQRAAIDLGDRRLIARAQQGIAECHYMHGEWEAAIEHFEGALVHLRSCGSRYTEGILLGGLAAALHRKGEHARAEKVYRDALQVHRETKAALYEGVVLHGWAALAHERGELRQCDVRYNMALKHAAEHEHFDDWAGIALCRSWALCLNHRIKEACEHARRAAEYLDAYTSWLALVEATCSLLDVLSQRTQHIPAAQARLQHRLEGEDPERGQVIAALILDAVTSFLIAQNDEMQRLASERLAMLTSRSAAGASLYARLATCTARSILNRQGGGTSRQALEAPIEMRETNQTSDGALTIAVGPEGKWLKIGDEEALNLSRRRSIRLILHALVEAQGGEPLSLYKLFDIGWPGQEIAPELAAERVYWAIRMIRDFGLRHWVTTSDQGYALDSSVIVSREEKR